MNQEEASNWDPKEIHNFLKNKNTSLMRYLKFLNEFFKDNIDCFIENEDITNFISENKEIFDNIEELVE